MVTNKNYHAMTDGEKQAWLSEYQQWLVDFSSIETEKKLSQSMREIVERGLHLLSAFNYCRTIVNDSLRAKDYHRRFKIVRRLADKVTADLQGRLQQAIDLTDPALLVPHVGRPTKSQALARALARRNEEITKNKAPNLFSAPRDDSDEPTAQEANATHEVPPMIPSKRFPSIAEIRWILSPALQAEADTIRDLRSRFEEASTRAKVMAEIDRAPADIAPYAQEASSLIEQINNIYAKIDNEMQIAYVRLKEDSAYIAKMAELSRMKDKELRAFLRPYWDKLSTEEKESFKASVIEYIKANDPAQATIRKAAEGKNAQVSRIIKYIQRKDKPNTLRRVQGLEAKIAELRVLIGDEADKYMPILTAAKEDYEQNNQPKQ